MEFLTLNLVEVWSTYEDVYELDMSTSVLFCEINFTFEEFVRFFFVKPISQKLLLL